MNEETLKRIERIEKELAIIDIGIRELEDQHEEILMSDEEYAEYVENYRARYSDEPLSIRGYYKARAELDVINDKFKGSTADEFERVWLEYEDQILELERILGA